MVGVAGIGVSKKPDDGREYRCHAKYIATNKKIAVGIITNTNWDRVFCVEVRFGMVRVVGE